MTAIVLYKGISELSPPATGAGGALLIANDKELADRSGPVCSSTSNPTVNDDSDNTAGNGSFCLWSKWLNTTTNRVFFCVDNTATAARWLDITAILQDEASPKLGGDLDLNGHNISGTGNITAGNLNISNWNTAYGWGNHASAGYALVSSLGTAAYAGTGDFATATQGSHADTAYGWGNPSGVYSPIGHNHSGVYSLVTHDHAGVYSLTSHTHAGVYSPVAHTHSGVYEPVLGNPGGDNYYLTSTMAGVRSWMPLTNWLASGYNIYYTAGFVGVGTLPSAQLHIRSGFGSGATSSPTPDTSSVIIENNPAGAANSPANLSFYAKDTAVDGRPTFGSSRIISGWGSASWNSGYIYVQTHGQNSALWTDDLCIVGGNIGIGTNQPGAKLDISGALRVRGSISGYVGLMGAANAGSTTYTLPTADGTSGQALITNGTGTLSWSTVASPPAGSSGYVQFNNAGSFGGNSNLFWDISNNRLGIGTTTPATALEVIGGITSDYIDFDLTPTGFTRSEGRLYWNSDDGTLNLGYPGGDVNLQIGQETLLKVTNKSGADIPNGKVVYIDGAQGFRPTIALADNTDVNKYNCLLITTEYIDDDHSGYVTIRGTVRDIDTTGTPVSEVWADGDPLYLGTNGNLTKVHPSSATAGIVKVCIVTKAHATEGTLLLTSPKYFTLGNNYNGVLRSSVINNNTGAAAIAAYATYNDAGYRGAVGIAGSNNTTFPTNSVIMYNQGYGDTISVLDGNHDHVWYADVDNGHSYHALNHPLMRLTADGKLGIGLGATTPTYTLDVNGIINGTALYVNGSPYVGSQWTTLGSDIYYNIGNVGIGTGTAAPTAKLDIIGTSTSAPTVKVTEASGQTSDAQQWCNSTGAPLARITASGVVITDKVMGLTTNAPLVLTPDGKGAIQGDSAGNARGEYAVDWQRVRTDASYVAQGNYSVIGGGSGHYAIGDYSAVLSGGNCSVQGTGALVCGGVGSRAVGNHSTTCGGYGCDTRTGLSFIGGGGYNAAWGYGSVVSGGWSNLATETYSTITGGARAYASHYGENAYSAGQFSADYGDAQCSFVLARNITTDATQTELFLDGSSVRFTLVDKDTYMFTVSIVGRVTHTIGAATFTGSGLNDATSGGSAAATVGTTYTVEIDSAGTPDTFKWKKDAGAWTTGVAITGSAQTLSDGITITFAATTGHTLADYWTISTTPAAESAAYKIDGCIDRWGSSTGLVGGLNQLVIGEDDTTWDATVVADDTNEALVVKVTGAAKKRIRWLAKIDLVKVNG